MTSNEEIILKILKEIEAKKKNKGIEPKTPEQRLQAQLDLPIGFDPDEEKKKVTLREVLKNKIAINFSKMNYKQKAEITRDRIKKQRRFEMYIGQTYVNKEKALKELSKKQIREVELLDQNFKFKKLRKAKRKIKIAESLIEREFSVIKAFLEKSRIKIANGELSID